jgi:ribosomal protein S18 acetylase RimI-like enzyme
LSVAGLSVTKLIRPAQAEDIEEVRRLFREYAEWVGSEICFESFARELAELPGRYAPPGGRLLLAFVDGRLAGCVALRWLEPGICEMKRLYIQPEFRGSGLGRSLVERVIGEAGESGYRFLRLDTLPRMERAVAMYRAFGFYEIPRYADNPASAICFELLLAD